MRIRICDLLNPVSGIRDRKNRIRDVYPGSLTLFFPFPLPLPLCFFQRPLLKTFSWYRLCTMFLLKHSLWCGVLVCTGGREEPGARCELHGAGWCRRHEAAGRHRDPAQQAQPDPARHPARQDDPQDWRHSLTRWYVINEPLPSCLLRGFFLKLCGIVLSKLPRGCCADFFQLCGIVLSKLAPMSCALQFCLASWHQCLAGCSFALRHCVKQARSNVLRAAVLLCGIVLSKLAPVMSCALQFCFAALCLASWQQCLARCSFALRNSECLHIENFLCSVVLWALQLVPLFR